LFFLSSNVPYWAAGVKAPDFLKDLDGLETNDANQLIVRQTLQTTRDENFKRIEAIYRRDAHSTMIPGAT
jgi:hypothetical protein